MRKGIMFGTDPEFAILDTRLKMFQPAHRFGFPVKQEKIQLDEASVMRDGYVVETNVARGHEFVTDVIKYNKKAMDLAQIMLPEDHELRAISCFEIDLEDLKKDVPSDACVFGCEPSFDSYTGKPKVVHANAMELNIRFAGGHAHFATLKPGEFIDGPTMPCLQNPKNFRTIGKLMDLYVGTMLAYVYNGKEQFIRRQYYGQAGEFRPQRYGNHYMGFEYRTPPAEIWNHPAMVFLVYHTGAWVLNNFEELARTWKNTINKGLQKAINTGDRIEDFLQTVPGIYDPDVLKGLRGIPGIYRWSINEFDEDEIYSFKSWPTFATSWGLNVRPISSAA